MSQYPPPGSGGYPPYGSGGYPPPPGGYGQPAWQESPKGRGLAVTALVLGILGLVTAVTVAGGILFGLIAFIVGLVALVKARRGSAGGPVMAGIGTVLGLLAVVAAIVLGIVYWNLFIESGGREFFDCVNDAEGDQAAITRCEEQFNQRFEENFGVTVTPRPTP